MSFQMDSNKTAPVGLMRYKNAEGKHRAMKPGAVGQHLLYAQLLQSNCVPEPALPSMAEPAAKRPRRALRQIAVTSNQQEAGSARASIAQNRSAEGAADECTPVPAVPILAEGRHSGGSNDAEHGQETAAQEKRVAPQAEKEARKKRDRYAAGACALLSGREDWREDVQALQVNGRSISQFRIAAAARGYVFGVR